MSENKSNAVIYSEVEPNEAQKQRFLNFLTKEYGADVTLTWKESKKIKNGFKLCIGSKTYDWTSKGKLSQFREAISHVKGDNIIPLFRDAVNTWTPEALAREIGVVESVGDGIATVTGLDNATYGEILMFEGGIRGMVQDIDEDQIGCILFDSEDEVSQGSQVRRTGKTAGVPVGEEFLGRVVDALGNPIDGLSSISSTEYMEIEHPAPGIVDRQPVNRPMETGILAIDSMFPIGRGQRELIIGDRQTGKTAIALDTILNQKGKDVVCVYVAIGQKASSIAQLVGNLKKHGALDYTVVVNASASDSASLQYIAPYSGTAIGEYFMHSGRDVLIVYDDLSKHAIAYRTLSLLLDRSPGREAYPGDVFYLHSRLLERSAHLSDELGGGSMTALPIVETQAGDVSAYIPTNIISITDGQIFLESDLFFAGQRPAVNVGLSVSRVGGDAQTKAMKKSTSTLRLDLAQYREMEVFTQFASDLDDTTKAQLAYGAGLMMMLRQHQYAPKTQHEQVIILNTALAHVMQDIPKEKVGKFIEKLILEFHNNHMDICNQIDSTGLIDDDMKANIISIAKEVMQVM